MLNHQQEAMSEIYGLTATENFMDEQLTDNPCYITGNCEFLNEIVELKDKKFDIIFSLNTFFHLNDPLGALILAYDKLKLGGLLVVDKFYLPGLEAQQGAIMDYLHNAGHYIFTHVTYGVNWDIPSKQRHFCQNFILRKTDLPLEFPVTYAEIEPGNPIKYKADPKKYLKKIITISNITKLCVKL
jgi:SAM-dependent methyltransferase